MNLPCGDVTFMLSQPSDFYSYQNNNTPHVRYPESRIDKKKPASKSPNQEALPFSFCLINAVLGNTSLLENGTHLAYTNVSVC